MNTGVGRELLRWYNRHKRPLPWRQTKDPYKIWVSEVMLKQTTAAAVIPYYRNWLRRFPDVKTLASARYPEVLKAWEGLGYYERAKNLHRAARLMCRQNGGKVPSRFETLMALPGFGPYITAAVLSIAYGQPLVALDANVRRVTMRLYGLPGRFTHQTDKIIREKTKSFFLHRRAGDFNQALMELGAMVCRPRNPGCLLCPLERYCLALKRGEQEIIPTPKRKKQQRIDTVVAIIRRNGRYLIQQRPAKGLMAGLWEFPGGKREKGETLRAALQRELLEELGTEVKIKRLLLKVRHSYTRFRVTLYAFECELADRPRPGKQRHLWVLLRHFRRYPFPSGNARVIRFLEETESRKPRNRPMD